MFSSENPYSQWWKTPAPRVSCSGVWLGLYRMLQKSFNKRQGWSKTILKILHWVNKNRTFYTWPNSFILFRISNIIGTKLLLLVTGLYFSCQEKYNYDFDRKKIVYLLLHHQPHKKALRESPISLSSVKFCSKDLHSDCII